MITGPGGSVGCFSCLTVGQHDGIRMTYPETPPFELRLSAMYNHPELITTLLGFTGVPSLVKLQRIGLDLILDFPHDPMHMVALGFFKASLTIMFSSKVLE